MHNHPLSSNHCKKMVDYHFPHPRPCDAAVSETAAHMFEYVVSTASITVIALRLSS